MTKDEATTAGEWVARRFFDSKLLVQKAGDGWRWTVLIGPHLEIQHPGSGIYVRAALHIQPRTIWGTARHPQGALWDLYLNLQKAWAEEQKAHRARTRELVAALVALPEPSSLHKELEESGV